MLILYVFLFGVFLKLSAFYCLQGFLKKGVGEVEGICDGFVGDFAVDHVDAFGEFGIV